ncbi:hypothetical protein Leryth_017713 [Lithospermum erythrorhizon]|nr:hypothetical protein Leryth_017713 [Lithospermum erythrorhizon]
MEVSSCQLNFNNFQSHSLHPLSAGRKYVRILPVSSALGLEVRAYNGRQFGFLSFKKSYRRDVIICKSRSDGSNMPCCSLQQKGNFQEMYHGFRWPMKDRLTRYIVVKSEIAGTGPAGSIPLAENHLASKVRGVCFYAVSSVAAIFLFVLMVVAHPFVILFDRYRRRAHHFVAKVWATLAVSPFFNIEIVGLENLPPIDTPAVYVSNHQSFLDIHTLLKLGRSFKFISKTAIFLIPIIGWAMFFMGVIPLKRMDSRSQLDCLKRCIELVKKGASVFFFPEGTRSLDGKVGPFKKGAFSVAAKTRVPVVPITLIGTGQIMPAGLESRLYPGSVKLIHYKKPFGRISKNVLIGSFLKAEWLLLNV